MEIGKTYVVRDVVETEENVVLVAKAAEHVCKNDTAIQKMCEHEVGERSRNCSRTSSSQHQALIEKLPTEE